MKVRRSSKHPVRRKPAVDDSDIVLLPRAEAEPSLEKHFSRTRKLTRPSLKAERVGVEATMRPPPPSEEDLESIETLRPLSKVPEDLERITPLRPPSLEALFHSEPTGALLKLLTPGRGHPLEEVKIPRKRRKVER